MKNIIFDIDGTLWDSTDVVAESWNEAIWEKAGIKANLDGDKLKKLFCKTMDEIGRLEQLLEVREIFISVVVHHVSVVRIVPTEIIGDC